MESTRMLDGILFANMLRAGAMNLRSQVQAINNLNVFPIPDGDTGDNMMLTIMGGVDAIAEDSTSVADVSRKAANGMLFGARGNSGVILSQLFDGIAEGFEGIETADIMQIGKAVRCGVQHAYNAVMEPTEGTILTVAKNAAEFALSHVSQTLEEFFSDYIAEAKRTLDQTPEMLPVLKKAGVVDSGGAGLVYIVEGMRKAVSGEINVAEYKPFSPEPTQDINLDLFTEDSLLEYGYCTELLLRLQRSKTDIDTFDVSMITDYLQKIGDSVVAFKTGSIVKIHVHTMTPDKVLCFCQMFGEFLKIKIENMSLQHNNSTPDAINITVKPESVRKAYGVVSVASGEGIKQLFTERGTDVIVDGGQSMNPSTEDFLEAFCLVNADTIFVLPNNSNIILTAKQAAGMYDDSDVRVIESHTIGGGYAALAMLDLDSGDTEQIEKELTEAMKGVITAEISRSVRDTEEVKSGDYIGFVGKDILASNSNRFSAVCGTIDKLNLSSYDICILIYGADANEKEAEAIENYIHTNYHGKEVYVTCGMQEIYDYILILE